MNYQNEFCFENKWQLMKARNFQRTLHTNTKIYSNVSLTKTRIKELRYNNNFWSPTKCLFLLKELPFQQIPPKLKYQLNAMKIQRIWYVAFKKKPLNDMMHTLQHLLLQVWGKRRWKRKELSKDRKGMFTYTMVKATVFCGLNPMNKTLEQKPIDRLNRNPRVPVK